MVAISVARKVLPGGHLHSELGKSDNSEMGTKIFPSTTLAGYGAAPWPEVFIVSPAHGPDGSRRRATRQIRPGRIAKGARRTAGLGNCRRRPAL